MAEEAESRWDSVTLDMLEVGDRVRVTHQRDGGNRQEAVVVGLGCSMQRGGRDDGTVGRAVQLERDGGIRFCAHRDAWNFEKRVIEVVLTPPRVGDRFTRRFNEPTIADRAGCVVRTVRDAGEAPGQTVWLLTYDDANGRYWSNELLVRPDGTCNPYVPAVDEARDTTGSYVPEPVVETPPQPVGWVPVIDAATLQVGDVVRATPHAIGGRLQATVRTVYSRHFVATTTHVITETSNGRRTDLYNWPARTGYEYRIATADAVVWRGEGPAPAPNGLVTAEAPIPAWATSLEAAHRHVHAVARRLYRRGDNCYDGSTDFVEALGLPSIEEDWAVPVPVDETAQIGAFLAKVREVALEVADDHGKDTDLVEGWLTGEGIVKPEPATRQHTVTFSAPADADLASVFTRLGWEVR